MVIKIYTKEFFFDRTVPYIQLFYPFWGIPSNFNEFGMQFDEYLLNAHKYFELSSLKDADFSVFPIDYSYVKGNPQSEKKFKEFVAISEKNGLQTIIFYFNDSTEIVPYENLIIFRPSIFQSSKRSNEYGMPAFCENLINKYNNGNFFLKEKNQVPSVGFVGYAAPISRSLFFTLVRTLNGKPLDLVNVSSVRRKSLKILSKNKNITTNFVMRKDFGGAIMDERTRQQQKLEFVKNIIENDYTLCARGAGNFSFRLFETLCCGRIPLFINTDCVLPFDKIIDWKDYCVWVDEEELHNIDKILLEYHNSISASEFKEKQQKCRDLWKSHLSPDGFFSKIHEILTGLK